MLPASQSAIDRFIDGLWLEDGLSANTLAAYRRDLTLLAHWLREQGAALDQTTEPHLQQYFAVKHGVTKATSANRRLTVFKRYFRWALRERVVQVDPTLRMLIVDGRRSKHCGCFCWLAPHCGLACSISSGSSSSNNCCCSSS